MTPSVKGTPLEEASLDGQYNPDRKKQGINPYLFNRSYFTQSQDGINLYTGKDTRIILKSTHNQKSFLFNLSSVRKKLLLDKGHLVGDAQTNHVLCSLRIFYKKKDKIKFISAPLRKVGNHFFFLEGLDNPPPFATFVNENGTLQKKSKDNANNYNLVEWEKSDYGNTHSEPRLISILRNFTPIEWFLTDFRDRQPKIQLVVFDLYSSLDLCDNEENCRGKISNYFLELNIKFKQKYPIIPFCHVKYNYYKNTYITQSLVNENFYEYGKSNRDNQGFSPPPRPFRGKIVIDKDFTYKGELFTRIYSNKIATPSFEKVFYIRDTQTGPGIVFSTDFQTNAIFEPRKCNQVFFNYSPHLLKCKIKHFEYELREDGMPALKIELSSASFRKLTQEAKKKERQLEIERLFINLTQKDVDNISENEIAEALRDENLISFQQLSFDHTPSLLTLKAQEVEMGGFDTIAYFLKHNAPIEKVFIQNEIKGKRAEGFYYDISEEDISKMIKRINIHKYIRKLSLASMDVKTAKFIVKELKNPKNLSKIDFSGNYFSKEDQEKIKRKVGKGQIKIKF